MPPLFIVAMSDHIFKYEIMRSLFSKKPVKVFIICLDHEPHSSRGAGRFTSVSSN